MKYLVHNVNGTYAYVNSLKAAAEYVADDLIPLAIDLTQSPRELLREAAADYGWSVYPGHVTPAQANKTPISL